MLGRFLPIALVVAILGGSAAAFAITEHLKLEKTPITRPDITKVFSPLSERGEDANVGFRLRKTDRITVEIVQGDRRIATLATDVLFHKGDVDLPWDGRDENGQIVPEGRYKPRVHLEREHRTIVIPSTIQVDTTAPKVTIASVRPREISPDHDGRDEYARVRFRTDGPARTLLLVDGRQLGQFCGARYCLPLTKRGGKLNWFGKVGDRTLRPGLYTLSVRAEDRAGNVSPASRGVRVRIRYVELPANVIRVTPRGRFRVQVDTDAKRLTWRLAGKSDRVEGRTLKLRAPKQPGRYTLFVSANGHGDKATVIVRRRSS